MSNVNAALFSKPLQKTLHKPLLQLQAVARRRWPALAVLASAVSQLEEEIQGHAWTQPIVATNSTDNRQQTVTGLRNFFTTKKFQVKFCEQEIQ